MKIITKAGRGKTVTALSLQGGGALGAYECGALKAIYATRGKRFVPRVVAGVSIGAINAAVLIGAKGDPIEALDKLWRERFCVDWPMQPCGPSETVSFDSASPLFSDWSEQILSLFGNPGMYRLKPEFLCMPFIAPQLTSSIYDTDLLKKTIAEFVDPRKLNRPDKTRLIVTAVNIRTGRLSKFDNAKTKLSLDHIVASGSFPVTFPMTRIDGDCYWDGGIFMNMPVGAAINALEQIEETHPDIKREVILVELHRMQGELPQTLIQATERFYNILFSGKLALDKKLYEKYKDFVELIHEIDKSIPADSPVRNHQGYKDLIRHKQIDRAIVIGETGTGAIGSASDFSRKTLNQRIEAGFNDAIAFLKDEEGFGA